MYSFGTNFSIKLESIALDKMWDYPADEYLKLSSKFWKTAASKHARTKEGRSILRRYVAKVRSAYDSALEQCGNDSGTLDYLLRQVWNARMIFDFEFDTFGERDRMIATLPGTLKTTESIFPNDPCVDDPEFFERVFSLRASAGSFNIPENQNLQMIYEKYKELWIKRYAEGISLLSEAVYMWNDLRLERIVSVVTEWETHGIKTDKDDVWENEIPSEVVPADVQDSFENDELYQLRMQHHDNSKNSQLFYGLPVGVRLPSKVPELKVDLSQAEKKLSEVAGKLGSFRGEKGMEELGKVANQYLRARVGSASGTQKTNSRTNPTGPPEIPAGQSVPVEGFGDKFLKICAY